jgi:DGQHR domain-containing protein
MSSFLEKPLLQVQQWLPEWEKIQWREGLEKPEEGFYLGSMSLSELRKLSAVTTRDIEQRSNPNTAHGYQRAHEKNRSAKINRYIHYGYPLSSGKGLDPDEHRSLMNPGWLPNAIIINVIPSGQYRPIKGEDIAVPKELEVAISKHDDHYFLKYPSPQAIDEYRSRKNDFTPPIEIIDGQHRLYAIDHGNKFDDSYEVPVVIFNNLSLGWQAYLFWTINVEPKKINASLAFDLYPELRRQDWLEQSEAIKIYQEHRSQELTETLWSHPDSPWSGRIELHGRRVKGHVSNAAFIRSLNSSFIKKWSHSDRIGGLFGSIANKDTNKPSRVVPWKRSQQAAFLIKIWQEILYAVKSSNAEWKLSIESNQEELIENLSVAFAGQHTLLATDQGVRAIHNIFNAIFQDAHEELSLSSWEISDIEETPSIESVSEALRSIRNHRMITGAISGIANCVVNKFDWRLSSAPNLTDDEVHYQSAYRGSSGYGIMMRKLVTIIREDNKIDNAIRAAAEAVSDNLVK